MWLMNPVNPVNLVTRFLRLVQIEAVSLRPVASHQLRRGHVDALVNGWHMVGHTVYGWPYGRLRLAAGFLPRCSKSICIFVWSLFDGCSIDRRHRPGLIAPPPATPTQLRLSPNKSESRLLAILAVLTSSLLSADSPGRHLTPWIYPDSTPEFPAFSSAHSLHSIRYVPQFHQCVCNPVFSRVEPPLDTSETFGIIGCFPWLAIDLEVRRR